MKIVINRCYGGYELSEKAYKYLGFDQERYRLAYCDDRTNPNLIKCVEELGEDASGYYADLKVIEIPDDVDWVITDYDGLEIVEEVHRSWW